MGVHHVALPSRDIDATHRFYTEVMGFELVKAVVAPTEHPGGWAKHLFYDTGGDGMIAFWDLHDPALGDDWRTAMSGGLGLPPWVAHLAFTAHGLDDLHAKRDRWLAQGIACAEIDHEFCVSIYATDPDGTMVEFCTDTRALTDDERREALRLLADPDPQLEAPPTPVFHVPEATPVAGD
ncbi:MAG TPA: VOC family protein [Acidimicrobiales bacterium]|nr:VOC family protein [Acidimicrobiales bacterium]